MSRSLSAAPPPLAAQFAPAGAVPNNNNNNPYTQFLIRSLTRNDQELAAVQELHVRLHALRQNLERRHPKLLLKHLGRGKIRLTTATLPTSSAGNDDRDGNTTSSYSAPPAAGPPRSSSHTFVVDRLAGTTESSIRLVEELQQEQQDHHNNRNDEEDGNDAGRPTELPLYDVAVSFLLHMKLRRRLLNRLARRLLRVAHALDTGKLPETPALPTYGDLRLHIDPNALRAFGQLRLEQERCLFSIQQQKELKQQQAAAAAATEAELSNPLITSSSGVKEEDSSGRGVKEEDDDIFMAAEALLSSEAGTEADKMEEDADDEDKNGGGGKADEDDDKKDDKKAINGDGESKEDSKKKKKKSSSKKKKEEEDKKKKKTPEEEEAEKRLEEQRQRERQEILRTSLPRLEYQPFLEYKEAYEKHIAIEVKKEEEEEEPSPQEDDDEEDKEEKDEDDEEEDEEDEAPQKKALRRMPHPSPALPRYTRLSSFSSSNNKQPESEGGESSSQPQQQQRKEDYERIPLGSMGIGAHPSSRLVHTPAERLAEFQAYKAGLYAKVPNQPRLYAQPRVFCYKQRLAKLKEQERAEKKRKEEEARQKIKQAVAPSARGGKTLRRSSEAKSPGGKTLKRSFDEGDDEKSKKEETVVSPSKAPGMGKTLVKADDDGEKEAAAVTSDKGNDSADDDEKSTPEDTQETQDDTDEEKAESSEEAEEVAAEEDEDTPMADVSETAAADAEEHSTGKGKDDAEEDEKMQTSDDDNEKSDDGEDAEHEKMTGDEGEEPSQDKTEGSDADSQKEEGEDEDQDASAAEDEQDTEKKTAKAEDGDDSGSEDGSGTAEKTNADLDRKEKASDKDTIAASDDSDDDDDYEDPVKNLKRPISLVPTPSFFDQDLKRIKLIHDELISTSMHNHARHRMEEVTRDYNAALRASNACFERRQSFQTQLQEMVQENRSYIGQMNSDYQVKLAVARNNWNARRQAFESQKLEHLMPQRHNPQHFPEGTAMTHLYIRQPDASRQIIAQYVGGMVDAISQIEQGTKTNQPFLEEFRPPPKPDAGLSHKKRMEDQIRQEIANLTQQLRVCEDERHKAWRRMMKTKAEFDVPHQHQRQRVAVNMNNYSALPMPPLRQSSSQNIPHEVARPSAAASFASYAPQQSRRPPPMAAAAGPDENPSKYAKYTAARVRQRIADDGTVAPVTAPKRTKDGLYQRPAGRTRKGKEWDAIRGLWVPSRSVNQE